MLPDDIDLKQLKEFGDLRGINRDTLINRMAASHKLVNARIAATVLAFSSRISGGPGRLLSAKPASAARGCTS